MAFESGTELLARLRALPAAAPLLARLPPGAGVQLVGGAVRDLLLGADPADLDLVVEGDAVALAKRLGGDAVRVHGRFATAAVTLDGREYDFATARRERYTEPGSLPEVAPAPLAEDLARRDFTANAVALALSDGALTAHPGALEDIVARVLRVVHDRSFIDDPTRLFRLARYAARLRFSIDPHTRLLATDAIAAGAVATVSGERVGAELRLLAAEADPVAAFAALAELGLDYVVAPGFGGRDPELMRGALALLPPDGRRDLLALACACHRLDRAAARELLARLGFEAHERDTIAIAAAGAADAARALEHARAGSEIAAALAAGPLELAALAGALGPREPARRWLTELRHVRLEINGEDLLTAGVPEGPAIGRALRAALDAKRDGRAAGRQAELAAALGAVGEPG